MTQATTLRDEALAAIARASSEAELESIEIAYLGRREGKISRQLMAGIAQLPADKNETVAVGSDQQPHGEKRQSSQR